VIPPGLTCARCLLGFNRALVRRTNAGFVHATPCESPAVLTGGRWVHRGGVARWEAA
jgi:hypothetical protein